MRKIIIASLLLAFTSQVANAQSDESSKTKVKKKNKIYTVNGDESFIFSMANVKGQGITNPRFSYFFNSGIKIQQDLGKKLTWFTGVEVKNMGIAQRDSVTRQRFNTYYAGVPIGMKFRLKNNKVLALSTGADFAVYAKDKTWNIGRSGPKIKDGSFFSDDRTLFNPYAAVSFKRGSLGLKATYYFQDYFTPEFYAKGYTPQGVNMFNISILFGSEKKGGKKAKMGWNSATKKKTRTNI